MISRLVPFCLVFAFSDYIAQGSVLVADNTMSRMVEVNAGAPFCALYNDRGVIQRMVIGADPRKVRQMSSNLVADLEETCKESRNRGKNQAPGGLIYPGTKWCGPGNTASSYNDLGQHRAEDACCREHDNCPVTIGPGQCIDGICNHSPITRSHCDCDAKFRRCLQGLNTEVANTLGALFFNVVQVTCFKERRPCSQWQRCYEWSKPSVYITQPTLQGTNRKFNGLGILKLKLTAQWIPRGRVYPYLYAVQISPE